MVSVYGKMRTARFEPESWAPESSPPTVMLDRKFSLPATATAVTNPFGGFSRRKRASTATTAAAAGTTPMNPFAPAAHAAPKKATVAAGKKQAPPSSSSSNPFATPLPTTTPKRSDVEKQASEAAGAGKTQEGQGDVVRTAGDGEVDGIAGPVGDHEEEGAPKTVATGSPSSHTGDGCDSSPSSFAVPEGAEESPEIVGGDNLSRRTSSAHDDEDTGSVPNANRSSGSTPAFSFDGEVFHDPSRLFGAHLGGKSYSFGRQRVEVVLRKPGGLRLGIWRPPLDEREEREREKEKGKAASEIITVQQHQMSRLDDR